MIRKLLVALLIANSPILVPVSTAQSTQGAQKELNSLLDWMAQFRPIAERSGDAFLFVEEAQMDYEAYLSGNLGESKYQENLTAYRAQVNDISAALIAEFEALPPFPDLSMQSGE